MYVNKEIVDKYQEFFDFMNQEHDLILTIEEMDEIVFEAQRLVKKLTIPVVVSSAEIKEPTFAEMRKKVIDSKQFTKKDGLWHHRKYGWKNLREAYEIANK